MLRCILAIIVLVVFTLSVNARPLGIGTSPQGTLAYTLGATVAAGLKEISDIDAIVQPNSGTGVMIPLVGNGELDIGFCNTLELSEAFHGTGTFAGRPQKQIRAAAVLFPIKVGFFVRADSPVRSISELKGKRLAWGYTSQAILQTVTNGLLASAGLNQDDVEKVLVPNLIRGADELAAGNVDAAFFAVGQAKVAEVDSLIGGVRFLPVGDTVEALEAIRRYVPTGYVNPVQPGKGLAGITRPTPLLAYDYVAFVNEAVSDQHAEALVNLFAKHADALSGGVAAFKQLDPKRIYRKLDVPYHDAVSRYFTSNGIGKTE
jgi:uncharacterized protein